MFESYYGWQPDESDTETINIDLADDDRDSLHESEGDKPGSEVDIEQDNGYDTDLDIDDHGEHFKSAVYYTCFWANSWQKSSSFS